MRFNCQYYQFHSKMKRASIYTQIEWKQQIPYKYLPSFLEMLTENMIKKPLKEIYHNYGRGLNIVSNPLKMYSITNIYYEK